MTGKPSRAQPPKHLSLAMRAWWRNVVKSWELDEHHKKLLTLACEAHDRATEARETLRKEGSYYRDKFDTPRSHPAVLVERDSRLAFARLLRELGLETQAAGDNRPPRLAGRYL
jgi:P27 family predicted phage terminase small subunit